MSATQQHSLLARPHSKRMAVPHLNFSWCQISVCASLADSYTNLGAGKQK